MVILNVEILKPKTSHPFVKAVKKLRSKKATISLDEITKEVESVRTKCYGK